MSDTVIAMANALLDLFYSLGSCLACFPGTPTLKVNNRNFKILRLLGEGGFSYVYLVQDTATAELFALKKIRCPFGAESVAQAMREVEAYRLFAHAEGIIHSIDYSVATERGSGRSSGGNVGGGDGWRRRRARQDGLHFAALLPPRQPAGPDQREPRQPHAVEAEEVAAADHPQTNPCRRKHGRVAGSARVAGADDEFEAEQQRPLMAEEERVGGHGKSYAHRDIKPGNIMIDDDGTAPVLMDLGSLAASPLPITSRSLALATQDTAAEHSTMPYRAPELFDVKTGTVIDTKVDIWSLGATLYACLVGKSPFELRSDETGGSLAICVLSGDWRFPDEGGPGGAGGPPKPKQRTGTGMSAAGGAAAAAPAVTPISEPVREVVRRCLRVEPAERPDIDELIELVEATLDELPDA
ncbi:Protein kinase-like domain protein [Niveomyces insectorum RCEF 264]|uniref:non-specific serine/threonine protein kinase n=1 Tax=Niveomyces insectorum RCEF 264 TaxID=1081102 RepID=A0A167ZUC5_9HYPO|nr:Protein kinase-like domain protein [Niveomyces insectorum RCEF 264]